MASKLLVAAGVLLSSAATCDGLKQTSSTIVSQKPANYPRLMVINNVSMAVGTVQKPRPGGLQEQVFVVRTSSSPEVWEDRGVIASAQVAPGGYLDLNNGYVFQMPNGTLLCAYRNHNGTNSDKVYRIQVSKSDDFGASWSFLSTIVEGPIGMWEPFLYRSSWDSSNPEAVHVAYSQELTNGGQQDIVIQDSADGGATWSAVTGRIHTDGSRNGMPGIIEIAADRSLVAVFEGFWNNAQWGHFTVNSARSFDGGLTWPQRSTVHVPAGGNSSVWWDAGSPQIGLCPQNGRVAVVYMSNELTTSSSEAPRLSWPDGAHLAVVTAYVSAANVSAPIDWAANGPPVTVPIITPTAFWPSLLLDTMPFASLSPKSLRSSGEAPSLRVVYQAGDGSGAMVDASLCD